MKWHILFAWQVVVGDSNSAYLHNYWSVWLHSFWKANIVLLRGQLPPYLMLRGKLFIFILYITLPLLLYPFFNIIMSCFLLQLLMMIGFRFFCYSACFRMFQSKSCFLERAHGHSVSPCKMFLSLNSLCAKLHLSTSISAHVNGLSVTMLHIPSVCPT